jgi:hypothetical protein
MEARRGEVDAEPRRSRNGGEAGQPPLTLTPSTSLRLPSTSLRGRPLRDHAQGKSLPLRGEGEMQGPGF